MNPVEQIFDPENVDNIVLYDDCGEPAEFEQIAVIPMDEEIYVILRPIVPLGNMPPDAALVFFIEEQEDDDILVVCEDNDIIRRVFDEYYKMLEEAQ